MRIVGSSSTGAVFLTSSPRLPGASSSAARRSHALPLALAPELDGRFVGAIGVLHDDPNRRRPSVTLLDEFGGARSGAWRCRQELDASGSLLDREVPRAVDRRDPTVPVVEAGSTPARVGRVVVLAHDGAAARATGARLLPSRGAVAATGAEQRAAERLVAAIGMGRTHRRLCASLNRVVVVRARRGRSGPLARRR